MLVSARAVATHFARHGIERGGSTRLMAQGMALALCLLWLPSTVLAQALLPQTELQQLANPDELSSHFGNSVSVEGDRALIGAEYIDLNGIIGAGSAYVYERRVSGEWVEVTKLTAPDAAAFDNFGGSVSLSDSRALIGKRYDDEAGYNSGAAYLFEPDETGEWVDVAKLTARDATEADRFGTSVVLLGDRALIGAPGDDKRIPGVFQIVRDTGSVYVFEPKWTGEWRQEGKITASDAMAYDNFGGSVALSENRALIGAGNKNVAGVDDTGAAYAFERDDSGEWEEIALLVASDGVANDRLGSTSFGSAALSADMAFVGVNLAGDRGGNGGSVYMFGLDASTTEPLLMLDVVDNAKNGFRFEGIDSHKDILERKFKFGGSDLLLTLTGYDIDVANEVQVLVNGTRIGFLARTPDNGRRASELVISKSLLNTTLNTIRFEQKTSGWIWGVENLLLSEINELPSLALDSVDTGRYGFRYSGINNHRTVFERRFETTDSDLTLTLTGFDIDTANEVRVLVNDTQIGLLARTPDNGIRTTRLNIDNSLMNSSTGNTLRFEQANPGWRWGVTNLVLSVSASGN